MSDIFKIGVVVCSDRASRGVYDDQGGPAIETYLTGVISTPWHVHYVLVGDDQEQISESLRQLADIDRCGLVLTTGGTGPAPRDVTPEATMAVCDRLLPGFGEMMRTASLREVPTAILSRQLAGTRGDCLIINLPGRPSSIKTCLDAVFPAVPYCLDLIGAGRIET
ncbi:MAG: molybdopterin adenylyltransferase, partial [Beijerinckiaceae bacterium]